MYSDIIEFNVGGKLFATTLDTIGFEKSSTLYQWYIEHKGSQHLTKDKNGCFFIDRDPFSFGVVLNFLRLKRANQLWEVCLPKDPDRLALLTQEADYYKLPLLRDQAIALIHNCNTDQANSSYVNEVCLAGLKDVGLYD